MQLYVPICDRTNQKSIFDENEIDSVQIDSFQILLEPRGCLLDVRPLKCLKTDTTQVLAGTKWCLSADYLCLSIVFR